MEYVDIIFSGINKKDIDNLIKNKFEIGRDKILRSHFYTEENGDFEYSDEIDLKKYFAEERTCNMFVSSLQFNKTYSKVLVIITSDKTDTNVTLNISADQFESGDIELLRDYLKSSFSQYDVKLEFSDE
ncbi:MAG: hypothetical protein HDT21_01750 [Ruminococcus sp.]|nr:hypothetical protein [Ruminococcus sp.]